MTDKTYPLHHTDAEPLYVQISQEEYDRLCKVDKEWKELIEAFQKASGPILPYYPDKFCPRCGKPLNEKKWRKVSEELPEEEDEHYLIFDKYGYMDTDRWRKDKLGVWGFSIHGESVRYFMPLPEPPEEK